MTEAPSRPVPTPQQVLDTPMASGRVETVRTRLVAMLAALWEQGDGFSPKRPLGYSDWEADFVDALVLAGWVDRRDLAGASAMIADAIATLGERSA